MVKLKLATKEDFNFFFELKSEDYGIYWGGHEGKPDREKLRRYFFDILEQQNQKKGKRIYIIYDASEKIGHLNIYPDGNESFNMPIQISEQKRGHGRAVKALQLGFKEAKKLGFTKFVERIREDNIASITVYSRCGVHVDHEDYILRFIPTLNREVKMYRFFKAL